MGAPFLLRVAHPFVCARSRLLRFWQRWVALLRVLVDFVWTHQTHLAPAFPTPARFRHRGKAGSSTPPSHALRLRFGTRMRCNSGEMRARSLATPEKRLRSGWRAGHAADRYNWSAGQPRAAVPTTAARQKLRATRQTNPKMPAFGGWDTSLFPVLRLNLCSCDVCSPFLMWIRLTRQFRGYPR